MTTARRLLSPKMPAFLGVTLANVIVTGAPSGWAACPILLVLVVATLRHRVRAPEPGWIDRSLTMERR